MATFSDTDFQGLRHGARERHRSLVGDGGDECSPGIGAIAGIVLKSACKWCRGLRGPLFGAGRPLPEARLGATPAARQGDPGGLARDTVEAYFSSVSICGNTLRRKLFSRSLAQDLQGYKAAEVLREHMSRCGSEDPLSQVQYADFKTYLPGDILTKVDRASMASSLEVRVPLLDHTLVEWAARLPSHLKLHGREGKYVFKAALQPHVPERDNRPSRASPYRSRSFAA